MILLVELLILVSNQIFILFLFHHSYGIFESSQINLLLLLKDMNYRRIIKCLMYLLYNVFSVPNVTASRYVQKPPWLENL